MRKLLFLSYWVPPRNAIGTIRSSHLLKHLPKFGWDVQAVTARLDDCGGDGVYDAYVQTGYCDLKGGVKRVLGIGHRTAHEALNLTVPAFGGKRNALQRVIFEAGSLMTYPDPQIGWLPFAMRALRTQLASGAFDAVLTSAPPATTNLATALAHGTVPWIADLRDLWAEDDSSERSTMHRLFDRNLERMCLSRAAALTVSSELSAKRFARRYPSKRCFAISTGFDADEWRHVPFGSETACTLLYAGTLYRGKRDPGMLFAALAELFAEGVAQRHEIRADFYTAPEPWLLELIGRFGLEDVVRVRGFVGRGEVHAAERRADRLIVLSWDGPTAEGVVAGKLFEYFGARRRVLAIGGPPSSSVQDLLEGTGAGVRARTPGEIKREIRDALAEHRARAPRIVPEDRIASLTGEACARSFASVLDYVVRAASA